MTAQAKTPEAWQGNGGNEFEPTLTKETIHLKATRTTETTVQTMPTPKVRDWLDAIPDVRRLPVADIFKAGFSKPERDYAVDYLVAAVRKVMN